MNEKTVNFFTQKDTLKDNLDHIAQNITDPLLLKIDELYGAADRLSIINAKRHRRALLLMAFVATLLTFLFLLYDEAEMYGLIMACGVLLACLFVIQRISVRWKSHELYLEYRMLAEALRVQFYLCYGGVKKNVSDLMPWSTTMSVPWIREVLETLDVQQVSEVHSIREIWITDQKTYHERALEKAERQNSINNRVCTAALIITVLLYVGTFVFELLIKNAPAMIINDARDRAVLKILMGTMSAVTLFMSSYYGKLGLPSIIDDYKRMIALYHKAEQEEENEELILYLAREMLNENSVWYSCQSNNSADLNI